MDLNDLGDFVKYIEALTKCPVCMNHIQLPIITCQEGHGMCGECSKTLTECPICRQSLLKETPKLLEELLQILPKSCKYSDKGCTAISILNRHEEFCKFRPITCMLGQNDSCKWSGTLQDWLSHGACTHSCFWYSCNFDQIDHFEFGEFNDSWKKRFYCFHVANCIFLLLTQRNGDEFIQALGCIPLEKSTSKHIIRLTFADQNGILYRFPVVATTLNQNFKDFYLLEKSSYAVCVPTKDLKTLVNHYGNIEVEVQFIQKDVS